MPTTNELIAQLKSAENYHPSKKDYPYYHLVPKRIDENIDFRKRIVKMGMESRDCASLLKYMCQNDLLFWWNTFAWTYDPRQVGTSTQLPFITYKYQDQGLDKIRKAIGNHDLGAHKSRDMGASWMFLGVYDWFFLHHPGLQFILVSRNEDYVDKPGFPKALFWKLRFIHDRLPAFVKPPIYDKTMYMQNLENDSVLVGEATTGNIARGDRATSVFIDELAAFEKQAGFAAMASVNYVTNSILVNSTYAPYNSTEDAFYNFINSDKPKLSMHWILHPMKRRGAYYTQRDGKLIKLDKEKNYPKNYNFICDNKLRSIYYDEEWKRADDKRTVAAELDMDPHGANSQFFDAETLMEIEKKYCLPPLHEGDIDYTPDDAEPIEFLQRKGGFWKLWFSLGADNKPPNSEYVIGVDIATGGNGPRSSNSVIAVIDKKNGKKIAEYACPSIMPHELAILVVAACKWFNNAFLVWEDNGPGKIFRQVVFSTGYMNFYYRKTETSIGREMTKSPGFWSTPETKAMMLGNLRRAFENGDYYEQSQSVIDECRRYVIKGNDILHAASIKNVDESGAGQNHGDRVIATGVAWYAISDIQNFRHNSKKQTNNNIIDPSPYSIAGRIKMRDENFEDRSFLARKIMEVA